MHQASMSLTSLTQRLRQSEVREAAAAAEPGDGGDLVAAEREDEQCIGSRDVRLGACEVDAECRLAVGAGRDEQRRAAADLAVVQERADRFASLVLVWLGRHGQP